MRATGNSGFVSFDGDVWLVLPLLDLFLLKALRRGGNSGRGGGRSGYDVERDVFSSSLWWWDRRVLWRG